MLEVKINHPGQNNGGASPNGSNSFSKAIGLLSTMMLTGIVAQNAYDWLRANDFSTWLSILAGAAILAGFLIVFSRPLYRIIDTPYFAISSLLAIAIGTAIGTFITQNTPVDIFSQRYGEMGSGVLRFLHLDDVFHSWWYVGFFVLLAVSLVKMSLKKKLNRENLGFHLAHYGPIIILCGFWVDYFYGFKGIIQLEIGESKNLVNVYDGHTNYVTDTTYLDFKIQLDTFSFQKYEPDYRIQIWKRNLTSEAQAHQAEVMAPVNIPPEILTSLPLEPMKIHHIYGSDVYFRLREFYPNFQFEYSYPVDPDTIEAVDPGIVLDLKTSVGDANLQLLAYKEGQNKIADVVNIGAWLEFYWELPAEVAARIDNPKSAKTNRIIFAGKDRLIHNLIDGELTSEELETGKFYPFPNKVAEGFTVAHIFPDAAYLVATPASKGDELLSPVAQVEIWHKGQSGEKAYLYPGMGGRKSGSHVIPGTPYFLALESVKDMETKFYRSELSVLGANDEVVKKQSVLVNEPMLYDGYRFYQTDYNPDNPKYSGIGISHEPGLYPIYFGFFVLVFGCFLMFYRRYSQKKQSVGA
jgi:ResB-like family protein